MIALSKVRTFKVSFLILLSLAVLIGGAAGCGKKSKPAAKKPAPEEPGAKFFPTVKPSAAAGQLTYKNNCAACHGENGAGDGPTASSLPEKPANFTDLKFMRAEEPQEFFKNVTNGKESMPKFKKKLTAGKRWDAVFFLWSRATSPMEIAAGRNIYNKNCVACHGKFGDGKGQASAGLKTKPPKFNDPEFMMKEKSKDFYEVLTNGEKPMPAFKKKLTDEQRWSAISYLWTFVYAPAPE